MSPHSTKRSQESPNHRTAQNKYDSIEPIKKRATPSLADRRATHTAVEKIRRDALNKRIQTLASLVPIPSGTRTSKYRIVNSTIAHLRASRNHRVLAARELSALETEANLLRDEVNRWRVRAGRTPMRAERRSASFKSVVSGEMEVDYGTGVEIDFLEWEPKSKEDEVGEVEEDKDVHDHVDSGYEGDGLDTSFSFSATDSDSQLSPISPINPPPTPFSLFPFFLPDDNCRRETGFGSRSRPESGENLFRYYQTNLWNSPISSQRFAISQRDIRLIH
ncbi:hypothetical protein AAF712_011807 [Marasmius tenuissimus]|uniref:BHLH domain-containing protein n=1 Tax=Marasmius tenuissimus TaxID=585030 RepID=A0ABR2ZK48_9AGAR